MMCPRSSELCRGGSVVPCLRELCRGRNNASRFPGRNLTLLYPAAAATTSSRMHQRKGQPIQTLSSLCLGIVEMNITAMVRRSRPWAFSVRENIGFHTNYALIQKSSEPKLDEIQN